MKCRGARHAAETPWQIGRSAEKPPICSVWKCSQSTESRSSGCDCNRTALASLALVAKASSSIDARRTLLLLLMLLSPLLLFLNVRQQTHGFEKMVHMLRYQQRQAFIHLTTFLPPSSHFPRSFSFGNFARWTVRAHLMYDVSRPTTTQSDGI